MKVKGANFFELHVEKIVLIAVAVVFVLVLVFQLGAEGPAVTINGQQTPLEQAYAPAENLARETQREIQAADPPLPEITESVDLLGRFQAARTADLTPRDRIASLGPPINLSVGDIGDIGGNARFVDLSVPAPADPAAYSFAATLDPWTVEEVEGLAALAPARQPYEKAAVSVQATFDAEALYSALADDPDGAGPINAWPINWWNNNIEILGVRLDRQRRATDGSWGETEAVPTPPGMLDLPAEIAEVGPELTAGELESFLDDVRRQLLRQVRQPDYYAIIAGEAWVEPREGARLAAMDAGINPEVAALERRLAQLDRDIERLQSELGEITGGRPQAEAPDRRTENRIRSLEMQIQRRQEQRDQIVEELTALGFAPEPAEEEGAAGGRRDARGEPEPGNQPLSARQPVELWAHDLTAEPGETYRYRLRAVLNNPAFRRDQFLIEEQRSMAQSPTILSEPSPWTEPVIVSPMSAFFVSSGAEGQQGAMGVRMATAGVEVFKFYYGYYRKGVTSLEPGDPVAAKADLPEGLRIFDTAGPRPEGGARVAPPDPELGGRRGPAPEQAEGLGTQTVAAADAYLLDVVESSARDTGGLVQGQAPRMVAFGDSSGAILRRLVGEDRRSGLYGRLSASAEAGRTQGEPAPEPEPEEPVRDPREAPPPPPVDPGGGGGGGGG